MKKPEFSGPRSLRASSLDIPSDLIIRRWSFSLLLSAWRKVWSAELQLCAFGSHTAPRGGVTGGGLRQGRRGALPFPLPGEEAGMRVVLPAVFLALFSAVATVFASGPTNQTDKATVLLVVGAPGEEEYAKKFEKWAGLWEKASREGGAKYLSIGLSHTNEATDLEQLKNTLASEPKESASELWLILLGHGTFDGKEAKFNLRGPDLSAAVLAEWLQPFRRPLALINCASSSGPFINRLSATNRVIVTATRSGYEQNYALFGQYISEAIDDPQADLDKDGQTSLLEAFLMASRRVAEFYNTEGLLATEHALLEDNGDGLGTPADWFSGIRAVRRAKEGALADGLRAHQLHLVPSDQERKLSPEIRAKRDELELAIARLRDTKSQIKEDDYYERLEKLVVELATLYEENAPKSK